MGALVGSIVGEVSALPSGSGSTLTDTGLGYDMAIGGLGFKLKISDDNKYERATAQFKKDQFDNSTEYGDQSLLGFWTRGQFSFHKGAGVTYYDTTDGETVLNRYRSGVGVKPFTPGAVSLCPEWVNTTSSGPFGGPIVWAGAGNGFLAFRSSNVLYYATSLTGAATAYTATAGGITGNAAAGPLCAYVLTTANKIERVGIAAGAPASAVIYTHATGLNAIFYAKDRLWVYDQAGVWYQLTPNPTAPPVAIAAGDKVFTAGDSWSGTPCLVDTPGPVLIGDGERIYSVTLDASTGAVPAMSGPVQVAQLPTGESLRAMAYHLGFLALSTSLGIRIGVVSDTGQVTYGPLLVEWATPTPSALTTIAAKASSVFVAGNSAIYEVNLAQQIGDSLEFGWIQLPDSYTDFAVAGMAYGAFTFGGNTLVAWAGKTTGPPAATLKHEGSNLAASGYLTTGYQRFGTLEPKKFHTVKMRVSGSGGTVTVYKVLSDGSEISLLTTDVATSTGEDQITLGMDAPTELVGLKFVLTRSAGDAAVGPTLLGYQLRALPAPKRQRLIRFPLMLMDVERRGSTRANGYEGSAWERLEALEDMEASGGVFQFQDFRTGEAGACQIESVEHQGSTPPGKQSNGFGGIVMLTVRKL